MIDWKERYEKMRMICLVLIGMMIGMIAGGIAILKETKTDPEPKAGQVVEKFMAGDTHFLQLIIAVSPEEYIGYDIGDEYEVKK